MIPFLAKRLASMVAVLFGVVTFTFILIRLTDGDPATIIALDRYGSQLISPEVIAEMAEAEGLRLPIHRQYANWLGQVARGEFGRSLRTGVPVMEEICQRFPFTLKLALLSLGLSTLIALPCGMAAACFRGGWFDRATRSLAAVNASVPSVYLAFLMILIFSVRLKWLPSFGSGSLRHLIMPVGVLAVSQVGTTLRVVRASVLDLLSSPHVRYAMLRGLSPRRILGAHVLRNALVPVITYLSLKFLMLIEGSILVETVFAWPGIGNLFQEAIMGRDFTMIQALVLFSGCLITLTHFVTDLSHMLVHKRMQPAEEA